MAQVKELQNDLSALPIQKKIESAYFEKFDIAKKIVRNHILFPALARIFWPQLRLETNCEDLSGDLIIESDTSEDIDILIHDNEEEPLDTKMERYFNSLQSKSYEREEIGINTEITETKMIALKLRIWSQVTRILRPMVLKPLKKLTLAFKPMLDLTSQWI